MSLGRILTKKNLTILGLNSGTSADGLDMAAVRVVKRPSGYSFKLLRIATKPYPASLRRLILDAADRETIKLEEIIYLDNILGRFCGDAARDFMSKLPARVAIDAIASHGQTVRHVPDEVKYAGYKVRGSLQVGSADFIAAATGKIVVSDFRQADIALGNEGAPITVAAMEELFRRRNESRLIVNIGGISNYFYFPAFSSGYHVKAADCGPGNSLSDILAQRLFSRKYDRFGRWARQGVPSRRLIAELRRAPFYRSRTTSTGRESFGQSMAVRIIERGRRLGLSDCDLLSTAIELTAVSIARAVKMLVERDKMLSKLYLTGGGKHNIFLIDRLRHYLSDLEIAPIDELGIDGDYVEAVAYAVMGEACLRSRALRTSFGKAADKGRQPVSGKITQPPGHKKKR